jgi:hypothetical protein
MTPVLRAELIDSSNTCTATATATSSDAPVLALCRELIKAGFDPNHQLHVYRGDILALRVRSIGEGALLRVRGNGVGFEIRGKKPAPRPRSLIGATERATPLAAGCKRETRTPEHPTPTIPPLRSRDRALAAGRGFDRHAGSNVEGTRAPGGEGVIGDPANIVDVIPDHRDHHEHRDHHHGDHHDHRDHHDHGDHQPRQCRNEREVR